ncbi:MAG: 16S rRNA (cytidine(1402)-2'-O)-methyltransferase [Deltaproteobacteria bacterium]|nr:16S rRNA (cytidine(1402)-2'-O)-methyltransferase [Deltaproteobacteria bacterium]
MRKLFSKRAIKDGQKNNSKIKKSQEVKEGLVNGQPRDLVFSQAESEKLKAQPITLAPGLYLVASPIGNLEDITKRAETVLRKATAVAAEDTRRSVKLLNHLGLNKALISYREQNHDKIWPRLKSILLDNGLVALLSDAGSPTISDPGSKLVVEARKEGFNIVPIPGPSAPIAALMASGFMVSSFTFHGFLPSSTVARRKKIKALGELNQTLVFFESPHRLAQCLLDLAQILGPRKAFIAREITKIHEEHLSGTLTELSEEIARNPRRGEITLVVGPRENLKRTEVTQNELINKKTLQKEINQEDTIKEELKRLALLDQRPVKQIAKELAAKYYLPKKEIYQALLELKKNVFPNSDTD